jgi:hypothetical protein
MCAQLIRNTSTPASTSDVIIASLLEAGPRVATILVRLCQAMREGREL